MPKSSPRPPIQDLSFEALERESLPPSHWATLLCMLISGGDLPDERRPEVARKAQELLRDAAHPTIHAAAATVLEELGEEWVRSAVPRMIEILSGLGRESKEEQHLRLRLLDALGQALSCGTVCLPAQLAELRYWARATEGQGESALDPTRTAEFTASVRSSLKGIAQNDEAGAYSDEDRSAIARTLAERTQYARWEIQLMGRIGPAYSVPSLAPQLLEGIRTGLVDAATACAHLDAGEMNRLLRQALRGEAHIRSLAAMLAAVVKRGDVAVEADLLPHLCNHPDARVRLAGIRLAGGSGPSRTSFAAATGHTRADTPRRAAAPAPQDSSDAAPVRTRVTRS
jgi:hypothetical protein